MKLHLPLRLRYALLTLFGLSVLPTQADVVLNDYQNHVVTDDDLSFSGNCDWSGGSGGQDTLLWFANQERKSTLTGNGVLSGISLQMLSEDGSQVSFQIGSGVTMKDSAIVAFENTYVTVNGTIAKGVDAIETGLYVSGEGNGVLDVSQATIEDGMHLSLMIEQGGTIRGGNFTLNSHRRFEIVSPIEAGQACTSTFDGNLTLADGARIEYSAYNDNGVVVPFSALDITGSLTISGTATLSFLLDNAEKYYVPADNTVLITCATLNGDLSLLSLEKGIWKEDPYDPSYTVIEDKVIKSMATADGYALYLATAPGEEITTSIILNDCPYGVNADDVQATDANLLLNADLPRLWDDEAGYDMGMSLCWSASNGGEFTLQLKEGTPSATMEGASLYLENEAAEQAGWSGALAQFTIGKGVGLQDCDIYAKAGTLLIVEGTNAGTKNDVTMFSVQGGGSIDLTKADMSGAAGVLLEFCNGTIKGDYRVSAETSTKGARELYVYNDHLYGGRSVTATLDGNLTIAQGGKVEFAFWDKNDGSNELTCTPLAVTGTLTIEGAAEVGAYGAYDSPWVLGEQTILFTCDTLQGDASSLSLTRFSLEDTQPGGEDVYVPFEGYTIKSMAYGDGYALYLAAAESIVPELVLNDYPADASIVATDTNLKLTGDWSATWDESSGAYPVHNLIDWVAETTGTYSLAGSGTMGGVDITASAAEGKTASFEIGSGVTLHDSSLTAEGGATLSFAGTLTRGMGRESWFAAFEGGTIDIREASIADDARLSLMMERGGTIRCGTYTADSLRRIEVVSPISSEVETTSTLDGNLVLADGGRIEYSAFKDGDSIVSAGALKVTGSVTIAGAATLSFVLDNASEYYAPADDSILITCSSLSGDLSLLKLETGIWDDDMMEPSYKELEDKVVKSMTYGSGYALYLAAVGGDNPTPPTPPVDPEPEVEIITNGTVTTPLSDTQLVQLSSGGTVDVSSLDSLPQQYISGTGGTLETAAGQTLALSGIQQVGYSIAAAAGEQSGAGLIVGRTGGKITDATIEFNGSHYDTASLQVRSGLAEIGTGTTLGNGTGESTIEVGSGAGSGVTASVNNFGTLEADVTINARGSMDNRKSIVGDVELNNGGVLINSGGRITGDVSVADNALLRNDGVMDGILKIHDGAEVRGCGTYDEVLVMGGGRLHVGNSPGRSSAKTLNLTSGSILSFTVDGTKPGNGAGYHSQMKVTDALTFNGVARAEVEVTRGILSCGLNTFTLTLLDASDATITDNSGSASPIAATIIEGAELLEDGYTFKWNAASGSLTLTGKVDAKAAATVLDEDGSIIANTLWSSTSMVRSFARTATSQLGAPVGDKTDGVSMWVAGLGDFISMDGFTSNAGGGALGAEAIITSNWRMGVALGVMSGTFTPDRGMDEVEQDGSMVGLYSEYVENLGADAGFRFSVYAAYGEVENEAKTYVAGSHELPGEATWSDDVFSVGTRLTWQFRVGEQTTLAPFIGLEYLSGTQESFTEKFAGGKREYRDGSMYTVSLPVGVTARTCVDLGEGQKLLPELTLAYVGDISRKTPEVRSRVFGIENNHKGTEPGRSAFMLNAGTHWVMSESWSMGAFYNLEARSKEVSQEATMFIRCNF